MIIAPGATVVGHSVAITVVCMHVCMQHSNYRYTNDRKASLCMQINLDMKLKLYFMRVKVLYELCNYVSKVCSRLYTSCSS